MNVGALLHGNLAKDLKADKSSPSISPKCMTVVMSACSAVLSNSSSLLSNDLSNLPLEPNPGIFNEVHSAICFLTELLVLLREEEEERSSSSRGFCQRSNASASFFSPSLTSKQQRRTISTILRRLQKFHPFSNWFWAVFQEIIASILSLDPCNWLRQLLFF